MYLTIYLNISTLINDLMLNNVVSIVLNFILKNPHLILNKIKQHNRLTF